MQMRRPARVEIAVLLTALIAHPVLAQNHPWTDDVNAARRALVAGDMAAADRLITAARREAHAAGVADPDLARAMAMLADRWHRQGRAIRAESLYVHALGVLDRGGGGSARDRLSVLANLAQARERLGRVADAVAAYEQAIAVYAEVGAQRDRVFAMLSRNLGSLLLGQERYEDAERWLTEALQTTEAEYGADHVEYARVLQPYARLLSLTDRPQLARAMGQRARAILGEDAAATDPPARAQANPRPAGAAPAAPLTPEPGRVYGEKEQVNGRYVLTTWPKQIGCARYDPAKRRNRARIADRYETDPDIERMPARIQAILEIVIGLDGIPERKLTKVLRTSDPRFDEDLISWVQACRFQPGKIGAEAVRVRIEFPLTMDFVR